MTSRIVFFHQNFCSNSTVLRTWTACQSCSISAFISCPSGFRRSPGTSTKDCKYYIRTYTLKIPINGCSFECYKEEELKTCCPGFWGPDCIECPEEAARPCSSRGVCSDGLGGNGTCTCQVGFAGTACEDCEANRYGPSCSSVCSCVHGLCAAGVKGDGRCTCFSGYGGASCDKELPECASLSCQQNSRCMEEALTGRLVCRCLPGYQQTAAQCVSVNPCLQQVCHVHATCVHSGPDQHLCACNHGYSGDGRVCMAVDPCQNKHGGCSTESTRCLILATLPVPLSLVSLSWLSNLVCGLQSPCPHLSCAVRLLLVLTRSPVHLVLSLTCPNPHLS
ncbi:stabilin-2 [Scomber scombrus]|uniref:Stabilin-2 n=1 Tax=Scomber scombrus TaxID=13677 RepID=A0AAV1QJL1_SCOSC